MSLPKNITDLTDAIEGVVDGYCQAYFCSRGDL